MRQRAPESVVPLSGGDLSPEERLAAVLRDATLLPAPSRRAVARTAADGRSTVVLVAWRAPQDEAWRVLRRHRVIAVGATPAEAVARAIFLWGS